MGVLYKERYPFTLYDLLMVMSGDTYIVIGDTSDDKYYSATHVDEIEWLWSGSCRNWFDNNELHIELYQLFNDRVVFYVAPINCRKGKALRILAT